MVRTRAVVLLVSSSRAVDGGPVRDGVERSPRSVLEGTDPGTVPGRGWDLGPFCGLGLAQSHCWGLGDGPSPGRGWGSRWPLAKHKDLVGGGPWPEPDIEP